MPRTRCTTCRRSQIIANGFKQCKKCRERGRERASRQKDKARKSGNCVSCLVRKARVGLKTCQDCAEKRESNRQRRIATGICFVCGKRPRQKTRKTCTICSKLDSQRHSGWRRRLKLETLNAYGGPICSCVNCPEKSNGVLEFLTIDHIDNNGAVHREKHSITASTGLYLWLRNQNYPDGFRVLCFNCNTGRHINGGACPHEDLK